MAITPTDTTIDFGQKVSVKCAEAEMITDSFVNLELVSKKHAFQRFIIQSALCSTIFQNVKLRLHGVGMQSYCHSNLPSNQILANLDVQKCNFW